MLNITLSGAAVFVYSKRKIKRILYLMRIIISPAKQMKVDTDTFEGTDTPVFIEKAEVLKSRIAGLTYEDQKKLWNCNDRIAALNSKRFETMDLSKELTPAILAFDGIQYTYMGSTVFDHSQYGYIQRHLRILSGFYGVLKPMDGVVPYRLEMQAKIEVNGHRSLYDFWGDMLYREVIDDSRIIINLASAEYSKCIEKYLNRNDRYITFVFGEPDPDNKEKIIQKGVYCKMARGEMVRYLAETGADAPEKAKEFKWSGYRFDENRSDNRTYYFVR